MSDLDKESITWDDARAYSRDKVVRTPEDWAELARVVESEDRATIPADVKNPDLRPDISRG